jgi:hypothetical protein
MKESNLARLSLLIFGFYFVVADAARIGAVGVKIPPVRGFPPPGFLPDQLYRFALGPKITNTGSLQIASAVLTLKEKSMRRNVLRAVIVALLLTVGGAVQASAGSPWPVPMPPSVTGN